jgi:hypothetical protein
MAKANQEALVKLQELVDGGKIIQIEYIFDGYEVTVYSGYGELDHHHYGGKTLIEAIMKAVK